MQQPRLLLIAATGGHLTQLLRLAHRVGAAPDSIWATFDSPQSRSVLAGKRVIWLDYVAPRDVHGTLIAYQRITAELRHESLDGVLSTGAAVAIAGFAWGRSRRLPCTYVESVSRTDGPSLTGKLVRRFRLARTFTQHGEWATPSWTVTESVLSDYMRESSALRDPRLPLKILVTLGTIRPFRFDRLVDRVVDVSLPADEIVWQLGETTREDLPGTRHTLLPATALLDAALQADVVITHSGVGTILELLDHGISPVVVPRRSSWHEHVDDHQLQIWRLLATSDVAHSVEVPGLTRQTLAAAASSRTVSSRSA